MHDGSNNFEVKPPSKRTSEQFGELVEGEAFVQREHEPADHHTRQAVNKLLGVLQLPVGQGKNPQKYARCLSDVIVAVRMAPNGFFCWPMKNGEYTGEVYTTTVARAVLKALKNKGWVWLDQKSSKSDGLARVYKADKSFIPDGLRFKCHAAGAPVIVRSKSVTRGKKTYGGERLARKQFMPEIQVLEKQVQRINDFHRGHPLITLEGLELVRCRRIFNNGDLKVGGRLYGAWQRMDEDERLACTIDGERLCEIDLKASYLSIAHAILVGEDDLGFDQYSNVKCVREANCPERQKQLRNLIKMLVVIYVSQSLHNPEKEPLTQYPKGKWRRDEVTEERYFTKFQDEYEVSEKVSFYRDQILDAFPFLKRIRACPHDVMYMESEIMLTAIDNLTQNGIPAYPVHDCLLVKLSDKEAALEEMKISQIKHLGRSIHMDCSYYDEFGIKEEEQLTQAITADDTFEALFKSVKYDWAIDDDFDVLET